MLKLVVLSCVVAAACASVVAPLAYTSSLAYSGYSAPLAYAAPWGLGLASSNYRGPLSLAPGQPANVLGADGRPLDTLDVNLDRSAHLVAKALDSGIHLLKKRSVGLIAPLAYSSLPYSAPIGYSAPIAYSTPLVATSNYRGPLSLAPGQPANILGADGRPLDTLDVNLDRSAHYVAKALNGAHILKKRSASLIAPVAPVVAHTRLITPASPILSRVAPIAHVAYSAYPTTYSAYPTTYASYW